MEAVLGASTVTSTAARYVCAPDARVLRPAECAILMAHLDRVHAERCGSAVLGAAAAGQHDYDTADLDRDYDADGGGDGVGTAVAVGDGDDASVAVTRVAHTLKDLKLRLSLVELSRLVGPSACARLLRAFAAAHSPPPSTAWLRRCAAYGECIGFHLDAGAKRTMQVPLNGDHEYEGGRLVYAVRGMLHAPRRPAGCYTLHDDTIAHGVSTLLAGVRYGLFLRD